VVPTVLLAVLLWAAPAAAGWLIEQVTRGETAGKQVVMLQANRMKTLVLDEKGQPAMAFIVDLDAQTLTQVDYGQRQYATATAEEYSEMMRGMMAGATAQMEQALKDLPPDQRKMMEQMMRSQMGQAGRSQADCREPRVEVRRTGEQATVAGHAAVRYEVLADGNPRSELWIAKSLPAWRELDSKKLERFATTMAKGVSCGADRPGLPGADPSWKAAGEGYPMRTVSRKDRGGTVEVVKAESRVLPAAEFQPPAGFARKALNELMGQ
jgi:hypothetical protein